MKKAAERPPFLFLHRSAGFQPAGTARLCAQPYVPAGRPRGDGREMSIIAIRSFSSYQQ